jgi:GNAT superfamily N-acetyltransferase
VDGYRVGVSAASSHPPSDPVTVRLGTPEDDPAIAALLAEAAPSNPKADLDVLRWQYRTERFGHTVTVVAEVGGEIIGHYSAVAVPVRIDGSPVRALRGVDIATAPRFQGRGVFRSVATMLLEASRDAGIDLIISNPNEQSIATLLSLGWELVGDPRTMAIVTDGRALAARAPGPVPAPVGMIAARVLGMRGSRHRSDGETATSDAVPENMSDLTALATPTTGIVHGEDWWRWRYAEHPRHPYRFVSFRRDGHLEGLGVVSLRSDEDGSILQLLELVADDDGAARSVAFAATRFARDLDLGAVVAAALPGSEQQAMLKRAGFVTIPRRWQPRPIHLAVADLTGTRPALADRRWSFSLGDQDHL